MPATTLRYYESAGLLPADRSPSGYRLYGEPAVERLGFIAAGKRLGLPLAEIGGLLRVWEGGACAQVKAELRPRLDARLAEADHRREEIAGFAATLRAAIAHLDALPDRSAPCDPGCAFLTLEPPASAAPVACSLSGEGVHERVEDWRRALDGATRTPLPGGWRLTVPIARLARIAGLAAAEQRCCPFIDFHLHLDDPHLHVQARAPEAGQALLTDLFGPGRTRRS